ncbi:hypothetical protein H2201_005110 [Coniosporium apollinis]|uniref:HMA domain-containing protein n=1 Tax=Coniosporium apollinis TaxID=61459 RepID=A0ABQ9NQR3_9PEZI|nr:hypothetical protein H2201_005110 [Coniosporium apollinis]
MGGTITRQTAFLISNLHCSSCVSSIGEVLSRLRPKPLSISHSIVQHTVTVAHPVSLAAETIAKTLEDEGYEVYSVIGNPLSEQPTIIDKTRLVQDGEQGSWVLGQSLQRWWSSGSLAAEERKKQRHKEHCEQCRSEHEAAENGKERVPPPTGSMETERGAKAEEFVVVHSTSASKKFVASLTIEGMSCSSCVSKISHSLEDKPWVESANVNLLTNSATVNFVGEDHTKELVEIIRDVGYEADIEQVEEVGKDRLIPSAPRLESDLWKASYTVGGMTCSSCVGSITKAVDRLPWVKAVDVNLIANSAVVVFEGKDHLDEIQDAIENVGYEAKLIEAVEASGTRQEQTSRRTVSIHVEGMYCEHCPERIEKAIRALGQEVVLDKAPTVGDPILKVSYSPGAPQLTVRTILASVSDVDPAFKPSIHHPMTIEERSRRMQAREQRHILYRLILSVIIAIPTLVIGIVYMALVSESDPNRQYLMEPLGGIRRMEWSLFALATPVYFFAADIFHRRMLKELRALWRPGSQTPILRRFYRFGSMNMLISLGTTIAYFSSIAEMAIAATRNRDPHMDMDMGMDDEATPSYFDSVVFLTMFLLAGRLIEAYSKAKTGDAVAMLGKLRPTEALLVSSGAAYSPEAQSDTAVQKINVDLLESGDIVRILHGGSPPCDGTVIAGSAKFDESSLTGESRLVSKSVGDKVYSGTVNQGGAISIRITGVAGASMLDQIIKVVREGQTRRAPVERVADALTSYFVPLVVLVAVSTWVIWLALGLSGALPESWRDTNVGGWPFWSLQFAIAVFVIACPCGIGLAAPTALFVGGGLAAKYGILVKGGGEAFQEASQLDCIVFDKTGTLTQGGEPVITDYLYTGGSGEGFADEDTALATIKMLEEDSSHPIAKAVVDFCKAQNASGFKRKETVEVAGRGMKGSFTTTAHPGKLIGVLVGNETLMSDHGVVAPENVARTLNTWKSEAKSVVLTAMRIVPEDAAVSVSDGWTLSAIFSVSDPLRPEATSVVNALQRRGIDVWMISGDNPVTAFAIGDKVGIPRDNIIAGVLPEQKAEKIKYLQNALPKRQSSRFRRRSNRTRATVAMVGDGINDSPALTMADVGVAIGSGSDVAISAAKFILLTSDLTALLTLTDLSRAVFRRIKFNFLWALIYNMAAVPVAAGVFYPLTSNGNHIRLDPVWAALAMALSSVSVVCSSLLLRSRLPLVGFRAQKQRAD